MTLEERLQKRLREWRKMAAAFRDAQAECDPSEEEYALNSNCAEMLERCVESLAEDLERSKLPA